MSATWKRLSASCIIAGWIINYIKIYDDLINKARSRQTNEITETHHINPAKMCRVSKRYGELDKFTFDCDADDSSNLVKLTLREHYIAHLLLARIYGGSMWYAANMMAGRTSREYSVARVKFKGLISKHNKNHTYTDPLATKERFTRLWADDEFREKMANRAPRVWTKEQKAAARLRCADPEMKAKLSKGGKKQAGVPKQRTECCYCHTYCSPAFLKRFHGDNCKYRGDPLPKTLYSLYFHGELIMEGDDPYTELSELVPSVESRRTFCVYLRKPPGKYTLTQNLEGYTIHINLKSEV